MTAITHPLIDTSLFEKSLSPCVLVIFGATGDLTARKLMPALYQLSKEKQLPSRFACVAFARRDKTHEQFRNEMKEALMLHARTQPIDNEAWELFSEKIFYHRSEFQEQEGYLTLNRFLKSLDDSLGTKGNRIYYLATQPSFFPNIIKQLHSAQLIYPHTEAPYRWSRVVFEKPFGHCLHSAQELQKNVTQYLDETQLFRIDHYLGKESVQNLLFFRFSNPIFESTWNNRSIDHIQITVAESIGIGSRGRFWEETGMLRDIVQNHLIQILTLIAMEPPSTLESTSIRDEKVKALSSIRPLTFETLDQSAVRGQYGKGYIDGEEVKGYREEDLVDPHSSIETFVALKLMIDNPRWEGVPFYLRAGKRLPKRATEVNIFFKEGSTSLFQHQANCLVIRIQPNEGISLKINTKTPGSTGIIQPVNMDFRYGTYFGYIPPEAYERLVFDAILGDSTLFARSDEVMLSWKLLSPLLDSWYSHSKEQFFNYPSGSWGPKEADALLAQDGHRWRLI